MGKTSAKPKGKGGKSSVKDDGLQEIDPMNVYFTHSKISGCGKRIEETIDEIVSGQLLVKDLPNITVLTNGDGHFYSLNNRRLYVLKYLRNNGHLAPSNTVRVRLKAPLPREVLKYTPDKCSQTCSIMRERPRKTADGDEASCGSAEEELDDEIADLELKIE